MKKWLKFVIWIVVITIICLGTLGFIFYKRFVVYPPKYDYLTPTSVKESQLQDLNYLALYPEYDKSFDSSLKRDSFNSSIEGLKKKLPLSEVNFEMEISKAVAIADNGHTNINLAAIAKRRNAVPLRFYWFKEGLFTILCRDGHEEFLGKRIKSINGIDVEELLFRMKSWYGGTPEHLKAVSPLLFISPEVLNAMGLGHKKNSILISIESDDNSTLVREVFASSEGKDIPGYRVPYWLHPYSKIHNSDWISCKPDSLSAVSFSHLKKSVHHSFIENALYVQLNRNYNSKNFNVTEYLEKLTTEIEQKKPNRVIFDLRFNKGGDYHVAWKFIKALNSYLKKDAKCYLITGNDTFSAGIITAAYIKYSLKNKVIILGEKVGDRMQFWADGGVKMKLPNTGLSLRIWTAYNDWANGCKDLTRCFWIAYFDGFAAGELNLNETIPLSFYDYIKGEDSVLNYILNNK